MTSIQIMRFITGRFLAAVGDQFLMFVAPLIVYKATGSIEKSGLAFLIEWTPRVLILPVAGFFADRFNHKNLYLIADFSRVLICVAGFLALKLTPVDPFIVISIMMALLALFNSLAFITIEATVPRLFPAADLPKAQSALQATDQLSQIAGPALAAVSLALFVKEELIGLSALAFMVSAANILMMGVLGNTVKAVGSVTLKAFRDRMTESLKLFLSSRELMMLSILAAIINLVMGTTLAQAAPIITGLFRQSDQYFGSMTTVAAICSIVTFTQIPKISRRLPIPKLGLLSLLGLTSAGLILGFSRGPHAFTAGYAMLMTSCAVFNVFMRTWRAMIIPKERMGNMIGLLVLINNSTLPLSGGLVAGLAAGFGPQPLILMATGVLGLITFSYVVWTSSKNLQLQPQ